MNSIAFRKPRPSSGGRRPLKSVVAYHYFRSERGATLGKLSAGRADAEEDAWSRTLRISRGEPIISPATPETYPAMKSFRLSAAG